MADINGWSSTASGSPAITYAVTYSQTDRSASSVSYYFNFAVNLGSSSSSFGYTIGYNLTINGQSFTGLIKDNTKWTGNGVHNIGVSATVTNVGASGGSLSCSFSTNRPNNDGTAGQVNTGGGYTVNISSFNTAPYWNNGSCLVSPSNIITEDTSSLNISWSGQADADNNISYYVVQRYMNTGGGWYLYGTIATPNISNCTDNIGSGNQGYQYYYTVYIVDSYGATSSTIQSKPVTKNIFTPSSISTNSSIAFATTSIGFGLTGIANTNGNTSFGYSLSCSLVTVYNPSSTPSAVSIWNGVGNAPSGTYIKFADIKSATASSNYTKTFTFTLNTWNAYGSSANRSCTMSVDLRTSPIAPTLSNVSGYYTIKDTNFYVTNKQNPTISWSGASDKLGGTLTYDIQVKVGAGNFTTVLSNQTGTNASIPIGLYTNRPTCTIRVIAKTSFGYTSYADSSPFIIDYYNSPSINFSNIIRNLNETTVGGTVTLNTSVPGTTVTTLNYKGKTNGSLSLDTIFSKTETNLLNTDTYQFSITVNDSVGSIILGTSGNLTSSITIPRYTPMFSIRELGVGVNAICDANHKLLVGGAVGVMDGDIEFLEDKQERFIKTKNFGGTIRFRANSSANSDRGLKLGVTDNAGRFVSMLEISETGITLEGGTKNIMAGSYVPAYDLNDLVLPGCYRISNNNPNTPPGCDYGQVLTVRGAADTIAQICMDINSQYIYWRSGNPTNIGGTGSWKSWMMLWARNNCDMVGMVSFFASTAAPAGWLKCNGASISRTSYSTLFGVIGTMFGAGNGSTTFNLPDLRGEFIRGWDDGKGVDSGRVIGSWQAQDVMPHTHPLDIQGGWGEGSYDAGRWRTDLSSPAHSWGGYVGVGGVTETRPRNISLLACIKY